MIRVYVAGAYSADNVMGVFTNIQKGMRLATEVFLAGFAPFCPWLDFHYTLMCREGEDISLESYYKYSKAWLEVSDVMIVVEGWQDSKGTQNEIKLANKLGIPVVSKLEDLNFFKVGD